MSGKFSKPIFVVAAVTTLGMGASATLAQTPYRDVNDGYDICWIVGNWSQPFWAITQYCLIAEPEVEIVQAPAFEPEPVMPEPEPTPPPPPEHITLSADPFFDFNKAVLRPRGRLLLSDIADTLQDAQYDEISVVGHTDRLGSPAYNQGLSEQRAEAVKFYLIDQGIPPQKIHSEGKGGTQPVTAPDQCKGLKRKDLIDCLQPDRRVDIHVTATKESN
ncbi:MAG: OmpA family protein [Burkholderiales bacterium]